MFELNLRVPGEHMALNALGAFLAAVAIGAAPGDIVAGLLPKAACGAIALIAMPRSANSGARLSTIAETAALVAAYRVCW